MARPSSRRARPVLRATPPALGLALAAVVLAGATPGPASAAPATAGTGTTAFVVSTVGAPPSARALDAALPAGIHVASVTPLGADLARIAVTGTLGASGTGVVSDALTGTASIATAAPAFRTRVDGAAAPVQPSDAVFPDQWDLWDSHSVQRAGGYGDDAARAWQRTKGDPSVVVAVLDTGITRHPDLSGAHLLPGYDFFSGGVGSGPGDQQGWDADPSDPGDACTSGGSTSPSSWHGTFVTGEIAATQGNGGVAGEAPGVSIEPVRVLGACGGSEADLIAAIEWASGGSVPGVPDDANPANVISLSLGGVGACDAAMQQAVADAVTRGTTVVVAAGNDDAAILGTAPANCDGVVAVAATTRWGNRAVYSNFGTADLAPTISAPGGTPTSPVWGDTWSSTAAIDATANEPSIAGYMGTSMATPRVSAAVALLLSVSPGLSPAEVRGRLQATVTHYPAGSTCAVSRCGPGILNVGDLLGVPKRFVHATSATITGTARAGSVLTAHPGTFAPGAAHLAYRWYRDRTPLAATGPRYTARWADRGALLTITVTASRSGYLTATARSAGRRIAR